MNERDHENLNKCKSSLADAIEWITIVRNESVSKTLRDALIRMQIAYVDVQYALTLSAMNSVEQINK